MRQLDAELRRFFARRLVRGMLLLVVAIIVVSVVARGVRGHAVSAAERARYERASSQFRQAPQQVTLPDGSVVFTTPSFVEPPNDTRLDMHKTLPGALEGTGTALLFVMFVLGASFVGAEYNVGSLTTQLMYEPRRLRVHAAKTVAVAIGAAVFTLLSLAVLAGVMYGMGALRGITTGVDASWWVTRFGDIGRITGAAALGAAMAYAVTLVVRRTSAGVVAFFLQYPLLFLIDPFSKTFGFVSHYNPLRGLLAITVNPRHDFSGQLRAIHTMAGGVTLACVWTAVLLVGAGLAFSRAEIR